MAIAAFYQAHQWPHRFTQMYWPNDYSTTVSASIGKTIQRLEARIKQHIPAYVLKPGKNAKKKTTKQKKKKENNKKEEEEERKAPDSAIGEHLVANIGCLNAYDRKQFTILTVARTQSKLDTLEALLIKMFKPDLYKQKEFVCCLHLF